MPFKREKILEELLLMLRPKNGLIHTLSSGIGVMKRDVLDDFIDEMQKRNYEIIDVKISSVRAVINFTIIYK